MNKIRRCGVLLLVILAVQWHACKRRPQPQPLPNIIYLLADDMGYGDLACQNPGSKIPTPNLDRLAEAGIRFTDAHAPAAVCTPTRYAILTGRYRWRLGRWGPGVFGTPMIDQQRLTVAKMLKARGYDTACFGKWHLGWDWATKDGKPPIGIKREDRGRSGANVNFAKPIANGPITLGFDYYFGTDVPNYPPYCFIENDRTVGIPTIPKPSRIFGVPGPMVKGWDLEQILPKIIKKTIEYIDAKGGQGKNPKFRQTKGNPFFIYLSLTAPHTPIAPSKEFKGKSQIGPYGDFIIQIDHAVAQVLQALKRNGFENNTLVIFTSDNGSPRRDGKNMSGTVDSILRTGHNPNYIYRGLKTDIWEGGHRIPFIARWPGHIKPGQVSDELICLTDLLATCAHRCTP
ncbi:MAG: arylsulfatase [Candidatus Aminicenantes bacterium]|nr:MAG: arylsulfatase [Candidatus Aminicenantes bacterium]